MSEYHKYAVRRIIEHIGRKFDMNLSETPFTVRTDDGTTRLTPSDPLIVRPDRRLDRAEHYAANDVVGTFEVPA